MAKKTPKAAPKTTPTANPIAASVRAAVAPSPSERLFFSDSGEDIIVAIPNGGVARVGATPRTLPPQFHRAAARAGCLVQGTARPREIEASPETDPHDRQEAIKALIQSVIEAQPDDGAPESEHDAYNRKYGDAFNQDETPNVRWLERELGFNIDQRERDQAWNELKDELGLDEEDDDESADTGTTLD